MKAPRRRLKSAGDQLVRIHRAVSAEPMDGYVVGLGRTWLLLQAVDDAGSFDGYSLVRSAHVTEMEGRGPSGRFVRRSLEIRGEWPPRTPAWPLNLNRTADLMKELSTAAKVLGIYIEAEDPDVLFVGVPFLFRKNLLGLREINADGSWRDERSQWSYKRLTRIDFGCRYVTRLLEVAELGEAGSFRDRAELCDQVAGLRLHVVPAKRVRPDPESRPSASSTSSGLCGEHRPSRWCWRSAASRANTSLRARLRAPRSTMDEGCHGIR